jgi:hypothetical protein
MQCMADDISILNNSMNVLAWLPVDDNFPSFNSSAVVLPRAVSEF